MDPYFQKKPYTVWSLLRTDAQNLGKIMQHADFLKDLDQKLGSFLGPVSNKHCKIANYANDTLILHVDTASWASKIRYNTPQILSFLQNQCNLASLKTIRIKVLPVVTQVSRLPDKRRKLNKKAADLISQYALSITDEDLKCSLLKISKHTQNNS